MIYACSSKKNELTKPNISNTKTNNSDAFIINHEIESLSLKDFLFTNSNKKSIDDIIIEITNTRNQIDSLIKKSITILKECPKNKSSVLKSDLEELQNRYIEESNRDSRIIFDSYIDINGNIDREYLSAANTLFSCRLKLVQIKYVHSNVLQFCQAAYK
jgi:hypothetical protein